MDRSIFITGAGRGIGRALALAFASGGGLIALASRTPEQLDEVAAAVEALGARALPLVLDVTDEAAIDRAFAVYRDTTTGLDVLVNNAGINGPQPVEQSDTGRWRGILDTNLTGAYLVSRAAIGLMRAGGRIINVSSVLGRFGVAGHTAYCASKHGLIGFTRALALELAPRGITVNAVCPGWVETEMAREGLARGAAARGNSYEQFREETLGAVPIGRIIDPEEVAHLVRFLASPEASAITGQTYNICGGQTMD